MEMSVEASSSAAGLHLVSAFLAMEPTDWLLSLAREFGGGSITEGVQSFILEHCLNNLACKRNPPSHLYTRNFLKKVIVAIESSCHEVLDGLYEQYMYYVTSIKDDYLLRASTRFYKRISFLFPDSHDGNKSSPRTRKLVIPLQCSLNMLEGDTGCCIWPSSLFLSEFILSYSQIFSTKSCFEIGSGVGLVGICLAYVEASKVVLSDGDLSTLANMKFNVELNQLNSEANLIERNQVECKYLRWESVSERELQGFTADIILGADIIYDSSCVPHLIQVLSVLLSPRTSNPGSCQSESNRNDQIDDGNGINDPTLDSCHGVITYNDGSDEKKHDVPGDDGSSEDRSVFTDTEFKQKPVAYIATVIRNVDTFDYFLRLAKEANLCVVDITETRKPLNLLPYLVSYDRASIRLYTISLGSF